MNTEITKWKQEPCQQHSALETVKALTAINSNASMVGKSTSFAQSRHWSPLPSSDQQALALTRQAEISGACYKFNRSSIACGREVETHY